jgi:protocatechuate 3,4-dioxygenase beta subunit
MFFESDPLFFQDPIFNSVPEHARGRMIARYDHDVTEENFALGWRWDIVLRGKAATPFEDEESE